MFSLFDDSNDDNLLQKFLLVRIANATYAYKIEYISEIIPAIEIFTIESLQNNILGLINLRGESIPVFDISSFLGKTASQVDEHKKFLILIINGMKFAIIIDSVGDIIQLQEDAITLLAYNQAINFLSTTVLNNETIIVIDVENFWEYTKNLPSFDDNKSLPALLEPSEKIKKRTALINAASSYNLVDDTFLNEKYLVFQLGQEVYAFNITYVKEIKKMPFSMISQIPCVPDFIVGIMNFRGDYISVLDIKTFLNIEKKELSEKLDIVILKIHELKIAILVDSIVDITNLPISNLNAENNSPDTYIIGELLYKDDKMINMLNVEKLFSAENVNIENYE